ncbi:uncharacterized protein [Erythrolamprus reginae]|uniref:uncharacterized protein n=1 Tax=Erythrolamprus reginae TaxID=121349 RepID=UPI00396CE61E
MLHSSKRLPSVRPVPAESLTLPEAYSLLAALMQFVAMVLLCVAIYMQKWVRLEPEKKPFRLYPSIMYTFGVPYKMNTTGNNTEEIYFFEKNPNWLRLTLITTCFLNLCFGVTAFLLDYREFHMRDKCRLALVSSFHFFSGLATTALVLMCVWCFQKVHSWFQDPKWKEQFMVVIYGEGFYIVLLAVACAIWAVVFTLCAIGLSSRLETPSKDPDTKK